MQTAMELAVRCWNVTHTTQDEGYSFATFTLEPTSLATESIASKSGIAFTLKRTIRVDADCVQVTRTSSKVTLIFVWGEKMTFKEQWTMFISALTILKTKFNNNMCEVRS